MNWLTEEGSRGVINGDDCHQQAVAQKKLKRPFMQIFIELKKLRWIADITFLMVKKLRGRSVDVQLLEAECWMQGCHPLFIGRSAALPSESKRRRRLVQGKDESLLYLKRIVGWPRMLAERERELAVWLFVWLLVSALWSVLSGPWCSACRVKATRSLRDFSSSPKILMKSRSWPNDVASRNVKYWNTTRTWTNKMASSETCRFRFYCSKVKVVT